MLSFFQKIVFLSHIHSSMFAIEAIYKCFLLSPPPFQGFQLHNQSLSCPPHPHPHPPCNHGGFGHQKKDYTTTTTITITITTSWNNKTSLDFTAPIVHTFVHDAFPNGAHRKTNIQRQKCCNIIGVGRTT